MTIPIPSIISDITKAIVGIHGQPILVGGYVRDYLMGTNLSDIKDIDIEVYGISDYAALKTALTPFGPVKEIGKSFGVLQLSTPHLTYDFSFPRKEKKTGNGHNAFDVQIDPTLSFKSAAARRDFTINSMGYDLTTQHLLDPYNGQQDIQNGVLRHIGHSFSEDPLRVLRVMQFAGRFQFNIADETIRLCQTIDLSILPKERLFEEFKKLFLNAAQPSFGLKFSPTLGILTLFPELDALINVPQDPIFHPEGNVWVHTMLTVDAMAHLLQQTAFSDEKRLIMMLAALCHDLGKAYTTKLEDGRWRSKKHDQAGIKPTESFLNRLTDQKNIIQSVLPLVETHMRPMQLYKASQTQPVTDAAIRRLACAVSIEDLTLLAKADDLGRVTDRTKYSASHSPDLDWLLSRAKALNVHQSGPCPFFSGKDLLKLGILPGPNMGKILKKAYQKQLNGDTATNIKDWLLTLA